MEARFRLWYQNGVLMRPTPPSAGTGKPVPPSGRVPLKADWPVPDRDESEAEYCTFCGSWVYHAVDSEAFCTRTLCPFIRRLRMKK